MEKEILKAQGTISKITTMEDRVLRLQIDAQEMVSSDEAKLLEMRGLPGWFIFSPNIKDLTLEEIKDLPDVKTDDTKSPSERLRGRMFVYFIDANGLGRKKEDFNDWYVSQLDKIGLNYLERMQ